MASTADFRTGLVIMYKDEPHILVEFQHVKPGKGGAFVRTKLKNVATGKVLDNTFRSGEKVEVVRLEEKEMQYLYPEGDYLVFMDNETYEQKHLDKSLAGDNLQFLKEGEVVKVQFHGDDALGMELPFFLEFEVTDTEPGVKGIPCQEAENRQHWRRAR
jgi:elongation factor P